MDDPRIDEYRRAVVDICRGRFKVSIPFGGDDPLGRLGRALQDLAAALDARSEDLARPEEGAGESPSGVLMEEFLDFVFESFHPLIPYDRIGLALLDEAGDMIRLHWVRSNAPVIELPHGYEVPLESTSLEAVVRAGEPRILNDPRAYLADHPASEATRRIVAEGMRSSLTCPLVALGKPVGVLFFSSVQPDTYRGLHKDHFLQVASQLSVIVEKSRLYSRLLQVNEALKRTRDELEVQAALDPLTGIWNRGAIFKILETEVARSLRLGQPIAAVLADIDHLKSINDEHGHLVGDQVLRSFAHCLLACMRSADYVGRYGGDEFILVLSPGNAGAVRLVMDRVQAAVGALALGIGLQGLRPTLSLGAAICRGVIEIQVDTLVHAADRALYQAKQRGRDRFEVVVL